jgi:uncharacterized caspase-like protein
MICFLATEETPSTSKLAIFHGRHCNDTSHPAYDDLLSAYPGDPMAPRVRAIIAARREAITWRRTRNIDTPQAYWSYLRRYRRGAHCDDARRRLAYLSAAFEPPPSFAMVEYDVPPPPPDEIIYVERLVLAFDDPDFDFAPPPPPPLDPWELSVMPFRGMTGSLEVWSNRIVFRSQRQPSNRA